MASCGAGGNSRIVPAELLVEMASPDDTGPPLTLVERLNKFFTSVPILFLITWPYWTAGPAAVPWLLAVGTGVGRRRGFSLWLWRTSILMLLAGTIAVGFSGQDLRGTAVIVVGVLALLVWLASSPVANRAMQWSWIKVLRRRPGPLAWSPPLHPVAGGCVTLAIQCFLSVAPLAWYGPSLLIGGMLAAGVNVALGVVMLATARQFKTDPQRCPRFSIRDLLIAVTMSAIFLAMFWARR